MILRGYQFVALRMHGLGSIVLSRQNAFDLAQSLLKALADEDPKAPTRELMLQVQGLDLYPEVKQALERKEWRSGAVAG